MLARQNGNTNQCTANLASFRSMYGLWCPWQFNATVTLAQIPGKSGLAQPFSCLITSIWTVIQRMDTNIQGPCVQIEISLRMGRLPYKQHCHRSVRHFQVSAQIHELYQPAFLLFARIRQHREINSFWPGISFSPPAGRRTQLVWNKEPLYFKLREAPTSQLQISSFYL